MSSATRIAAARALTTRSTRPLSAQPWYAAATALRPYSSTPSSSSSPSSSVSAPSTSTSTSAPSPSVDRPTAQPQPTNLPGSNLPGAGKYSPLTVSIVTKVAKLFGYHSQTSTAIRTTSDYYDRCAERGEIEAPFFYEECSLPPSFQTWFSVTTLHVWLLSVRFRSLPPPLGRVYVQELINHFFIDVELRIRGPYAVTQSKLIKGYMKDMLEQYHGSCAAYDEGLISNDAVLAAALWRNVFGAGWGGVGGVKGKRAPKTGEVPKLGPNPNPFAVDPVQIKVLKKDQSPSEVFTTDSPIVDPKRVEQTPLYPDDPDLEFAISLEKMVRYIRREVMRMERLPDQTVILARPPQGPGSLVEFTRF
ncbi:BQ2448_2724 [Microbotryum intermedium]|uniref:BQ2448_2724 protein n=1 Tax=Microbotryum intermedium TaxID=269621 RepID=A0A238FJ82_9BASI|nr:BQ2448_2724 [Microbotryum intermedium]